MPGALGRRRVDGYVLINREERNLDYGQDFTLSELTELFTIIEG